MARRIDRSETRRRPRGRKLGMWPQETREAGRPDDDRRREPDAEKLDRLVALRRAFEQLGDEFDRSQRRLVAPHGDLVAGGAVHHVEHHARQPLSRERA